MYRCQKTTSLAYGFPSPGGFTVKAGSVISEKVAASFEIASPSYYALRNRLIEDKVIVGRVFQDDYEFRSPSAAASVVVGWTISGKAAWIEE